MTISDALVPGAVCQALSALGNNDNFFDPAEVVTCTGTYTTTPADVTAGSITNTASASSGGVTSNTDTETVYVPGADLSVTKDDGSATYTPGGTVTYTIVVTNAGPSPADGATFTDDLPEPPLSNINWTCGSEVGGAVCPNASGTGDISETIATFPSGGSLTYTVTADIAASATGNLVNTVSVAPPAGTTDPTPGNDSATDTDTPAPQADLAVTKDDSSATYLPGGSVTYTIVVTNNGPSDADNSTITDDLPEPPLSNITWTCGTETGGAVCPNASGLGDISETIATFPAGGSLTYTVTADIDADATGNLVNTVSVAPPAGVTDPTPGNDSATDTDTAAPEADLAVTKTDGSLTYTPGGTVTYTIVVSNAGPDAADGAVFADDLPEPPLSNITWTCGTETGGAVCPTAAGTGDISETIATFPAGGSLTYTVTADIAASATGNLVNTVSVAPPPGTTDPTPGNDSATDTDTPAPQGDLAVTKDDGSATYLPGGSVTYTIVVSNAGPSDANGATITDDLPEPPLSNITWTCGSETGGAVCPNASGTGDISETIATFPAGGSLTYTVTADIDADATGNLVNTVDTAPPAGVTDATPGNDSATDTDTADPQADIAVVKSDGSATYTPGGNLTYTIVVTNNGPSDADNSTITDDLPEPPLSNINWTCGTETGGAVCPNASGSGDISEVIATFPAGGSLTYTVTADIDADATGNLVNTVSVAPPAGTTDPTPGNDSATDTDTPAPQADLAITKDDGSATYTPGGSVTYAIVVSNAGPSDANGATITDDLPEPPLSNITWTCGSETGGAVCPNASGTGDISETIATFPAGGSLTYTVTADIDADTTGNLVNTVDTAPPAGVTDPTPGNDSATDTDTADPQADIAVVKSDGSATYTPGGNLTYTIVVTNNGPSDADGATITDDLPEPPLSNINWTCGTETGGAVCPTAAGTGDISETIATFPAGGSLTYTVTADIAASATGNLVNTVSVAPPAGTTDPTPGNDSATDTDTPAPQADLAITKDDGSATYTPGGSVTYTIVVSNNGPSDAGGATIIDDLPEPPLSNITWTCGSETGGAVCPNASGTGDISEAIATFPSGGSLTYTVTADIASNATGNLANTVSVAPPAGTTDPTPGNDLTTDTDTPVPEADLAVTKTDGSATYTPGGSVTYTIVVTNNGPSDAGGATITDDLPEPPLSNINWTCGTETGGAVCPNASGTSDISETIATFPAGGSLTYTVTADIAASATGNLVNTVSVAPPAGTTDPTPGNDSATDTDTPAPQADLAVRKDDGSATYLPGGSVTYTIVVTNNGPSDANGATITDDLPEPPLSNINWTCGNATGGAVCPTASGTGDISETIATFPAGGSLTYTVTADIDVSATGDLVNTVSVAPPGGVTDPDPSDDDATDTDSNNPQADLSVTKDDGSTTYTPGGSVTYNIVVSNAGPSDANGATITDDLPEPPLSNINWTCGNATGGAVCSAASGTGDINETIATFPAGGSLTYTVTADIDVSATGDLVNTASVAPPGGVTDSDPSDNDATDTDSNNPQADLSVTKDDGSTTYTPGGSVTYTIVVSNAGPSAANGATITDDLPEPPLSNITWTCGTVTGGAVCSAASGTGDLNEVIATFPAGGSLTYTVTADIDVSATGDLVNTVSVAPPGGVTDPDPSDDDATDTDSNNPQADLSVTKDDGSTTYTPGGSVTYTIVVSNAGPNAADGATFTDDLPEPPLSNITWTCGTETGGAVCPTASGTGDLNEVIATFPAGGSLTYTVTADIEVSATGDLVNTVNVAPPGDTTDPDPSDDDATDTDSNNPQADLSVTKDDGSTTYTPGGSVTYNIVVSNAGPNAANGATITDDLPEPPLSNITWTCGSETGGAVCPNASGTGDISETIATFPSGGSLTYMVTADIDVSATGDLVNTVSVAPPGGVTDPDPSDDDATDTDSNNPQADLSVTKDDGSTTYTPGGSVTYTIVVSNAGPNAANGATITDDLPEPPLSNITWTCGTETGGAVCPTASGTGDLNEVIATFPAGGSLTYTVTADIDVSATGDLVNTVSVAPPVGITDPDDTDNTATDTDQLYGLEATKSDALTGDNDGNGVVSAGDVLTYTVIIENMGSTDFVDLVFTDTPGANLTLVVGSVTVSDPSALVTQDTSVTVQIPLLQAGQSVTITFDVVISDPLPDGTQTVSNQGSVSGPGIPGEPTDDPDTGDEDDPTDTEIGDELPDSPTPTPEITYFDPSISKVGVLQDGGLGLPGERLTWIASITNIGTGPGYDIVITDDIQPDLRIDGADTDRGTATIAGQTVTFYISYLNPGESVQARIYTTVLTSPLDGLFENTAYGEGVGANGVVETASGSGVVSAATGLPSTGYAPSDDESEAQSSVPTWIVIAAAIIGMCLLFGSIWIVRMRRV